MIAAIDGWILEEYIPIALRPQMKEKRKEGKRE